MLMISKRKGTKLITRIKSYLPWISHSLLMIVTIFCLIPMPAGPPSDIPIDKIVHIIFFMALTFFYSLTFKKPIKIFLFFCIYGAIIEVIQYFMPWRSFELYDIVADIFGSTIGMALYFPAKKLLVNS